MFRGHLDPIISQIVEKEDYWLVVSDSLIEAVREDRFI